MSAPKRPLLAARTNDAVFDLQVWGAAHHEAQHSLTVRHRRGQQGAVGTLPAPTHRGVKCSQHGVGQSTNNELNFEAVLGAALEVIMLGGWPTWCWARRSPDCLKDRRLAAVTRADQTIDPRLRVPNKVAEAPEAVKGDLSNLH